MTFKKSDILPTHLPEKRELEFRVHAISLKTKIGIAPPTWELLAGVRLPL